MPCAEDARDLKRQGVEHVSVLISGEADAVKRIDILVILLLTRCPMSRYAMQPNEHTRVWPREHGADMSQDKNEPIAIDLDFAPSWARQSPEELLKRYARDSHDGGSGRSEGHGGRGNQGDRRDQPRREDRRGGFEKIGRRPREERRLPGGSDRAPFVRSDGPPPARTYEGAGDDRMPHGNSMPPQEQEPMPFEMRLLPEQKALGSIIRRIQTSHRAYPLRDIAHLFLDNPASCLVRLELRKDQPPADRLFQCKVCGLPALTEEEIAAHLVASHIDHFFDIVDIEGDPPAGNFTCVARCGLSGVLLGPPNHHSYAVKVQEQLRSRYANMSAEAYHSRIEMVREPEVIEQWREQARKKRIYRLKQDAPAATQAQDADAPATPANGAAAEEATAPEMASLSPALERDAAERLLQREIVPRQITAARSLVATVDIVRKTSSQKIAYTLREALFREQKFPASLFFALRGAFRHRKLQIFKANNPRGPDFVVITTPSVLDIQHATEEIRTILGFVTDHPGATRQAVFAAAAPDDEAKQQAAGTSLNWLIERGHLIEYYNGVLSIPTDNPVFRYLPGERPGGGARGDAPPRRDEPRRNPAPQPRAPAGKSTSAPVVAPPDAAAPKSRTVTVTAPEPVAPEAAATESPVAGE